MKANFNYPPDLIEPLRSRWPEWQRYDVEPRELPDDDYLAVLLESAYHASFTADEQRRTRFAAVICDPQDAFNPIVFDQTRAFIPHEIMRLAPVAAAAGTMFGICCRRFS